MAKEYKELTQFNGMNMNVDTFDTDDTISQFNVNVSEVINGKLSSSNEAVSIELTDFKISDSPIHKIKSLEEIKTHSSVSKLIGVVTTDTDTIAVAIYPESPIKDSGPVLS